MPVSKHNLWKRKKNGLMKLVRSHSDWLQERRETKARVKHIKSGVHTVATNKPTTSISKGPYMADTPSSAKRTQVGKKI